MSQEFSEAVPLSVKLLDTRDCQALTPQLCEFENAVFGPDFACDYAQSQSWIESGCLFYSAVCGEAVAGRRNILSMASIFITTRVSRDRLLAGQVADYELTPWTAGPRLEQPAIYLSSIISDAPHHLAAMYDSLLRDAEAFRSAHGMGFQEGFAIATGSAGCRHMTRSGFRLLEGYQYRAKYDLMVIDANSAATKFWQGLLRAETVAFRQCEESNAAPGAELPPVLNARHDEGGAREVEKRLALAKAERYRNRKSW